MIRALLEVGEETGLADLQVRRKIRLIRKVRKQCQMFI